MFKNIRILSLTILALFLICNLSFANIENEFFESENLAQVYDGQVRINTLRFDNNKCEKPILIFRGNYYLPLYTSVLDNLGMELDLDKDGIAFGMGVPKVTGEVERLAVNNELKFVDIGFYSSDIVVDGFTIKADFKDSPVVQYRDTIYIPLTKKVLEDALKVKLNIRDNELVLVRDLDSEIRGTIYNLPQNKTSDYLESVWDKLILLEKKLPNYAKKIESNNQIQYIDENNGIKNSVIYFDDGSVLVSSQPNDDVGHVLHINAETNNTYIGEYKNDSYYGIGKFINEEGDFTRIDKFDNLVKENKQYQMLEFPEYMPVLTLLVNFEDTKIKGRHQKWYQKLFGDNPNSLRGYYKEVYKDKLKLVPAMESDGEINDGIVQIDLDMPHMKDDKEIVDTEQVTKQMLSLLEDKINMKIYDTNDNGVIDRNELAILVVFAGYEKISSVPDKYAKFHSHFAVSEKTRGVVDDIGIVNTIYVSENMYLGGRIELEGNSIIAHEFAHQLGLPDLYDTDGSSRGLGIFSLMSETATNYIDRTKEHIIPYLDSWSLIQLGVIEPQIVDKSGEYVLNDRESENYNIIRINTKNKGEYFLLENRILTGRDYGIRQRIKQREGILIYHVDEGVINKNYSKNKINADENDKGIDIEESSEERVGEYLDKTQNVYYSTLFQSKAKSEFSDRTVPSSRLKDGTKSGIAIKILENGRSAKIDVQLSE